MNRIATHRKILEMNCSSSNGVSPRWPEIKYVSNDSRERIRFNNYKLHKQDVQVSHNTRDNLSAPGQFFVAANEYLFITIQRFFSMVHQWFLHHRPFVIQKYKIFYFYTTRVSCALQRQPSWCHLKSEKYSMVGY